MSCDFLSHEELICVRDIELANSTLKGIKTFSLVFGTATQLDLKGFGLLEQVFKGLQLLGIHALRELLDYT